VTSMTEHDDRDPPPLHSIVEALLFATGEPLSLGRLAAVLREFDAGAVGEALDALREACERESRPYALEEIGGGYRLLTRPRFAEYLRRLHRAASGERLSPAALETLAIVAFKQPVIKAEVDAIRGVKSEGTLQSLLRRHLVKVVGRADVLGRPLLYGTTKQFLDQFGLKSLDELPSPEEALQKMEAAEFEALNDERVQITRVDLDPEEGREDELLTRDLPETPAFRKDEVLAAEQERDRASDAAGEGSGTVAPDRPAEGESGPRPGASPEEPVSPESPGAEEPDPAPKPASIEADRGGGGESTGPGGEGPDGRSPRE
jgi:segregation and condensation protein B